MSDTTIEVPQGTVEYLYADVVADRTLNSQPVEIGLGTTVTAATWDDAQWTGASGTSRSCRILLDGSQVAGRYAIFVRITDTPEIPIIKAGYLKVKVN